MAQRKHKRQRGPRSQALASQQHYARLIRQLEALRSRQVSVTPIPDRLKTYQEQQMALEAIGAAGTGRLTRARPSGNVPQDQLGTAWGGAARNMPQGVPNARVLRQVAEQEVWVRAAIDARCDQVARADIAVLPLDENRPWNKKLQQEIQLLLDQPNEFRDSWRTLIQPVVEDILVLDRGVIEKSNRLKPRVPLRLYYQDGARIKIYPGWSGDPDEPRYLFEEEGGTNKKLLLNDEAIVMIARPGSYRLGLAPVATLYDVINADLKALASGASLVEHKPPPHIVQIPKMGQTGISKIRDTYDMEIAGRREILWMGGNEPAHVFPLIFSAKDNQWLEWQIYLARQICAAFKISPQQLGITFDINRATAETQQNIFEDTGLMPLLLLIEEYLNREVLDCFAKLRPDGRYDTPSLNLRIIFPEVSEAMRKLHYAEVMDVVTRGQPGLPALMPNDVRRMLGEEPVPGGNRFWTFTQTNGPLPWIGYDDDLGNYTPQSTGGMLGAQDPETGPQANEIAGSEATGDETSGDGETPGFDDGSVPPSGPAMDAPTGKAFGEWRLKATTSNGHTTIWLGLALDRKTAKWLAIPGGEPVEDLHITLAMLGEVSERSPADLKRLRRMLVSFATAQPPLDGTISGIGRFTDVPEDEPTVVYASPDIPGLPAFRDALVRQLTAIGFAPDTTHGYSPHITLAYLPADAPMPIDDVPALRLHFEQVWLAVAGERSSYDLDGEPPGAKDAPPPLQKVLPLVSSRAVLDTRLPGKRWSSALLSQPALKGVQPRGRVPAGVAATYSRPAQEVMARDATRSAVQRIFEEALARGRASPG